MSSSRPGLIFFRGMNTYGDDVLHVGPVVFGESYKGWVAAVGGRVCDERWDCLPIRAMGAGTVTEMSARSRRALLASPLWQDPTRKFHVLAHSTGGIVARAFVHDREIQERVLSLTTIGSPHQGADAAVRAGQVHPAVKNLLRAFGYDLEARQIYFRDLLPSSMEIFNEKFPNVAGIHYASVLSEKPAGGPSLPMHLMELSLGYFSEPSDGLIPVASQRWGEVLGSVQLDHLEQAGFCLHVSPSARRRFRAEWKKMFALLENFWLSKG